MARGATDSRRTCRTRTEGFRGPGLRLQGDDRDGCGDHAVALSVPGRTATERCRPCVKVAHSQVLSESSPRRRSELRPETAPGVGRVQGRRAKGVAAAVPCGARVCRDPGRGDLAAVV